MSTPKKELIKPCVVLLEPVTPKVNLNFSAELKKAINERNMLTTKTRKRVTEALDEIQEERETDILKNKKRNILNEILESEESYVKQLETVINFFIKPLKEKDVLKPKDFEILFGSIDSIYKINSELLKEIRKGSGHVVKAFSKIAPFFKSYSFYAFEFKKSLEILQNCNKDNPKFAKFLELQESRPEVQSKLSALLIAPIQRIPRYKLLLQSLFNLTRPSESDYECLKECVSKVENAAEHVNKIIQERENMQRLIELQRCFQSGEPNVITPGRRLIKEGTLMRIMPKDGHSQKLYVVLTNDIIMFCKIKKGEPKLNSLKCSQIYPLNKCNIKEIIDKGSFRLLCEDEEIVLYHDSFDETKKWIGEIRNSIQILLDDRRTLKKDGTVRRPVKRKDVNEYNEVGISPGKKLKKRRSPLEEEKQTLQGPLALARRRPIRSTSNLPSSSYSGEIDQRPVSSIFITLKPDKEMEHGEQKENSCFTNSSSNSNSTVSKELFVFGQPNPQRGFSFKMNQWLCGIGSSVKKVLGFK